MENPYQVPPSAVEGQVAGELPLAERVPLFTPRQVRIGALLGGLPTGVYLLRRNFLALGRPAAAWQALLLGAAATLVLWSLLFLLSVPRQLSTPINIGVAVMVGQLAEQWQLGKQAILDSRQYRAASGWKTFGISMLGLLASVLILIALYLVLHAMGLQP